MSLENEKSGALSEKHAIGAPGYSPNGDHSSDPESVVVTGDNALHKELRGRHMQMIAMQVQQFANVFDIEY